VPANKRGLRSDFQLPTPLSRSVFGKFRAPNFHRRWSPLHFTVSQMLEQNISPLVFDRSTAATPPLSSLLTGLLPHGRSPRALPSAAPARSPGSLLPVVESSSSLPRNQRTSEAPEVRGPRRAAVRWEASGAEMGRQALASAPIIPHPSLPPHGRQPRRSRRRPQPGILFDSTDLVRGMDCRSFIDISPRPNRTPFLGGPLDLDLQVVLSLGLFFPINLLVLFSPNPLGFVFFV
jgi:hypothetical protein